jgi:2-dehydro-3-deoxygluconokinase
LRVITVPWCDSSWAAGRRVPSLCQWHQDFNKTQLAYVSVIPANAIGDACIGELRRQGIDTSHVVRNGSRLGIYFLEAGASQRPSVVIHDRAGAAIAEARRGDIDWEKSFTGAAWFHLTGAAHRKSRRASARRPRE